jgi:hypothetical protein
LYKAIMTLIPKPDKNTIKSKEKKIMDQFPWWT